MLMLGFVAMAQSDSLNTYLTIAAKNNATVQQKLAEYQAALQKVPQAGSLPDPELSAGVFMSPMELLGGRQVADLRLMQMFPWFGTLQAAKDEMSLMAQGKYALFRAAKLEVYFNVQRTFNDLIRLQQSVHIAQQNLEILHATERLAMVVFSTETASVSGVAMPRTTTIATNSSSGGMQNMGGGSDQYSGNGSSEPMPTGNMGGTGSSGLVDIYRIQMQTAELESRIAQLKDLYNTALAQFNAVLNRPPLTQVMVPEDLETDTLDVSLTDVSEQMLAHHPMLEMLSAEEKAYAARKTMVTKMGYPMIGIGLNYSVINKSTMSTSTMNGNDMIMPMVTVTLPVYRKKIRAMQHEADYNLLATKAGFTATTNELQAVFFDAVQQYNDARRRITLYQKQQLTATQSLNILTQRFSATQSGLTDLLQAQRQLLDFQLKLTEAIADNNTAIARLKLLMSQVQIN